MIKKTLIAIFLIILVLVFTKFYTNSNRMKWGHHFCFENKLGIDVDSLEMRVGNVKTMIKSSSNDSLQTLEGNIDVPENGYPHKTSIQIFSNGKTKIMKSDSFDCYNCDGNHTYILREPKAEYYFLN